MQVVALLSRRTHMFIQQQDLTGLLFINISLSSMKVARTACVKGERAAKFSVCTRFGCSAALRTIGPLGEQYRILSQDHLPHLVSFHLSVKRSEYSDDNALT